MMVDDLIIWDSEPPSSRAIVEERDHFDARGMKRVYGRGDYFGRSLSFQLDIWIAGNGRLLMRCWSRCQDIDWRSFEIKGINPARIPASDKSVGYSDHWIPDDVRRAYNDWVQEEF